MKKNQEGPYRVFRVGGRTFDVFLEYDEQLKESYPAYPDFKKKPEYAGEGRPFATAEQESCAHCKPRVPGASLPDDCGGCFWFYRENKPYDPIGVCLCDKLRREDNEEEKE